MYSNLSKVGLWRDKILDVRPTCAYSYSKNGVIHFWGVYMIIHYWKLNLINSWPYSGTFRQWEISKTDDFANNRYSLKSIMRHFAHEKVDILKIDIELAEFDVVGQAANDDILNGGRICQILIEVHGKRAEQWTRLLKVMNKNRFFLFAREPNPFSPYALEMSFIHQDCLPEFNVPNEPIVKFFD